MTRRFAGIGAGAVGAVMIATALLAGWLVASSGILNTAPGDLGRPAKQEASAPAGVTEESVRIAGALQLSQPRDPFKPLITPDSPVAVIPGLGGTPGAGGTDGNGFVPGGTSITLVEINEVDGELEATIVVNGVTYQVKEGETFADSYQVIELTEDSAVIMFGDTAFELKVGQQILK